MKSPPLTETEWQQVLALAAAEEGRTPATDLSELQAQGVDTRLLQKAGLQLELGEPAQPSNRHRRGEHVGDHIELRGHLRDGGSSSVYLGIYEEHGRVVPVAVKLLRLGEDPEHQAWVRQTWLQEQRLLREFSGTGAISPLIEAGEHTSSGNDTFLYLCTEYKHGLSLARWCEEYAPDVATRLRLLCQVCDAVAVIHRHGLVHGDLKPDNIQVETQEGVARAWLLDLGSAAVQGQMLDGQGHLIGSPGYMSPEQISERLGPVTEMSDVYALGMMTFELLEERPWLDVRGVLTPVELHMRMLEALPLQLNKILPMTLRKRLQTVLDRATAHLPRDRYLHMAILREALSTLADEVQALSHVDTNVDSLPKHREVLSGPPAACGAGSEHRSEASVKQRVLGGGALVWLVIGLVVCGAWLLVPWRAWVGVEALEMRTPPRPRPRRVLEPRLLREAGIYVVDRAAKQCRI